MVVESKTIMGNRKKREKRRIIAEKKKIVKFHFV